MVWYVYFGTEAYSPSFGLNNGLNNNLNNNLNYNLNSRAMELVGPWTSCTTSFTEKGWVVLW